MKQPDDLDQQLVRAAKSGSRSALGKLLQRHEARMRSAVRVVLRNAEDVEDCLQEANARVTASIHTFRDNAPFGPWIRRVAFNAAISAFRRAKGRTTVALPVELAAPDGEPKDQLITNHMAQSIRAALATLPAQHRRVLELRLIRGLSHTEVAEVLQVPKSSARVLFVRAMERLRKTLGEASR